jgi:hypothetical protein
MRTSFSVSTVQAVLIAFLTLGCGPTAEEGPTDLALNAALTPSPVTTETAGPVVDHAQRSVDYALECAGGAAPKLTVTDKKSLVLACPEEGGRRLKVVCPESVEVTRLGGHFNFNCQ